MFGIRNGGPNGYITFIRDTFDEAVKGFSNEWAYSVVELVDGVWVDIPDYISGAIC